jgi:hypothetical protein
LYSKYKRPRNDFCAGFAQKDMPVDDCAYRPAKDQAFPFVSIASKHAAGARRHPAEAQNNNSTNQLLGATIPLCQGVVAQIVFLSILLMYVLTMTYQPNNI